MSQTRKPRQDRAEPRRRATRKATLGGLTLGGLWALAAHADGGATPAAEERGDALEHQRAAALSPQVASGQVDAPVAALAQASALHEELRQLVAGLVRETSHPAAPSRAPATPVVWTVASTPTLGWRAWRLNRRRCCCVAPPCWTPWRTPSRWAAC